MERTQFHRFIHILTQTLTADDRVRALAAIGSLAQAERIDPWSDHDFWVITTAAGQTDILADLSWLPDHHAIVLTLRPAPQYVTALYSTGHIIEFAVFAQHDLSGGRLTHYQILFDKDAITTHIQAIASQVQQEQRGDNASSTFGHFLITLCTGIGRAARGEYLSAHTYIFQYAVDALLTLITHHVPPLRLDLIDSFEPRRRFERSYPDLSATLATILVQQPITAAQQLLALAEQLFPDQLGIERAVIATHDYLQTIV